MGAVSRPSSANPERPGQTQLQRHGTPPDGASVVNAKPGDDPSIIENARSAVKDIASGLRTVLKVTDEVSDAFPPLKGVVSGLLAVWDVYEVCIYYGRMT